MKKDIDTLVKEHFKLKSDPEQIVLPSDAKELTPNHQMSDFYYVNLSDVIKFVSQYTREQMNRSAEELDNVFSSNGSRNN